MLRRECDCLRARERVSELLLRPSTAFEMMWALAVEVLSKTLRSLVCCGCRWPVRAADTCDTHEVCLSRSTAKLRGHSPTVGGSFLDKSNFIEAFDGK